MTLNDFIDYHPIFSSQAVFVTGTDTGIGKTYVTQQIIRGYQERQIAVFGIKPAITGFVRNPVEMLRDDCEIIRETCLSIKPNYYTPLLRQYVGGPIEAFAASLAPISASRLEGREFNWPHIEQLLKQMIEACRFESIVPVIEGIGGPLVPIGKNLYVADAIASLRVNAVLVTRTALGTISHTLTGLESLHRRGVNVIAVVASRSTQQGQLLEVERSSLEELTEQLGDEMPFYVIEKCGTEFIPVETVLKRL